MIIQGNTNLSILVCRESVKVDIFAKMQKQVKPMVVLCNLVCNIILITKKLKVDHLEVSLGMADIINARRKYSQNKKLNPNQNI